MSDIAIAIKLFDTMPSLLAAMADQPSLPACALACIEAFASASAETLFLETLSMPDVCLQSPSPATQACLLQHCSPADALGAVRFVAAACHWPVRSRKAALLALFAIQIPAVACLCLRLYAVVNKSRRYVDDYLTMAVTPLFITFLVLGQYAAVTAFGADIWTVPDARIASAMRAFYIDEMLYLVILALVRLSLLFLYLRLFAPQDVPAKRSSTMSAPEVQELPAAAAFRYRYRMVYNRRFRLVVLVIAFLVALPTIVFFFLDIFQCRPISTVWTKWTSPLLLGETNFTCLNVPALAHAAAAFGIAQDMAILAVPWPLLYVLRRSLFSSASALATAVAMFSLGVFVLITSCIRLHFLVHFSPTTTTNPTWDNTDSLVWSGLEVSVSIIVASLPTVRAMVQSAFKRQ